MVEVDKQNDRATRGASACAARATLKKSHDDYISVPRDANASISFKLSSKKHKPI